MSAKGNCYDNAQAESFFSRFKAELIEGWIFESVEEARIEIFSYIEGYYNRLRLHSGLAYKSPLEFEKELKIKQKERQFFVLKNLTVSRPPALIFGNYTFKDSHTLVSEMNIQNLNLNERY